MKKITANDPISQSTDILADNIQHLKALFPEVWVEDKIDFDVLKQLLGGLVEDREEKYSLNWHGKRQARQLALSPSTGTLRPCPEESVNWDTTQNLMIEGDNLEVLKLLQKSYAGKVKLIYIAPPDNRGKDFVSPDNYQDNIRNYLELTGQVEGGRKISSNTEARGRFHTDWLNMMYPMLKLARNLLCEGGVVFVSIANHEIHNLHVVLGEIFGEENFIATVIWQKVFAPKNSARHFSEDHDYIVIYAKNAESWTPRLLPRSEVMEARYGNLDKDPRGPWASDNLTARNYYGAGTYSVTCPSGRVIDGPPSDTYWRVSKDKFNELDRDNRIWWGSDGNNMPRLKRFLSDVQGGRVPQTLWTYGEVGHTQEAKKELIATVDFPSSDVMFDTPKPTRLIRRILQIATNPENEDIVVDFFGGTGTTMDAVFQQNAEDGGKRRCILVQLPEPLVGAEAAKWSSIFDITKARLVGANERPKTAGSNSTGDTGFRVFKLDTSNIRPWSPVRDSLEMSLMDYVEHIKNDRSEADVLHELLLKLGLDLCVPMEQRVFAGKTVHSIGGGVLLVCLDKNISSEILEELAQGLVEWHKALAPVAMTTCVFQDNGFADDVVKTNLAAIRHQHGLVSVRSL